MFYLWKKARNFLQANDYVTTYFNSLMKLWQEINLFNQLNWKDPEDANIYFQILARERIYDFLSGLNHSLDDIWGQIISTKSLPDLDEIFDEVLREENRKQVMLDSLSSSFVESSAMTTRNSYESNKNRQAHLWCDHCQCPHHTKATCWKLHGKPTNWVPKNQRNSDGKGFW